MKIGIIDQFVAILNREPSHGRRGLLLLPLMVMASSCVKSPTIPNQDKGKEPLFIRKFSEELRTKVRINFNGGPAFDFDPNGFQLPKPDYTEMTAKSMLSRTEFSIDQETRFAIFSIDSDNITDLYDLAKKAYKNVGDVLSKWAQEKGNKHKPFRGIKGNHSITYSKSVLRSFGGDPLIPFCEYKDNTFNDVVTSKNPINNRQFMFVGNGEEAKILLNLNLAISDSLIAINLASRNILAEKLKQIGLVLTIPEITELLTANEISALYFEEMRRHDPATYNGFIAELKARYNFPPDNNSFFEQEINAIANSTPNTTPAKVKEIVSLEALKTVFEFEYIRRVFNK